MIEKLSIKNYLIIKEVELNFTDGLNILTGETGAGKSIILDALSMILGERANFSLIRKGEDRMVIEGMFDISGMKSVKTFLRENDFQINEEVLIMRREIMRKGVSRNFINDSPASINQLKLVGDIMVDIHSQNEHQALLKKETHLSILDSYAGLEKEVLNYGNHFVELSESIKKLNEMISGRSEMVEKKKYYNFQLKEINEINPLAGEYEKLEKILEKSENREEISIAISETINLLNENEKNILSQISKSLKNLERVGKIDSEISEILKEVNEAYIILKDAYERLISFSADMDFDSNEIEKIRDRLGTLSFLKKRYNRSIDEIIEFANRLKAEIEYAENYDEEIEKTEKLISEKKGTLFKLAKELSQKRLTIAKEFDRKTNGYLKEIGLAGATFKTMIKNNTAETENEYTIDGNIMLSSKGIDDIEFLINTTKGGDFTSLKKTASGGEISRVMLAIKAALAGKDEIPVLIFDEIDTGISGSTASKVGKLMSELSKKRQIIAITHLPQIAAISDNHFSVSKKDEKEITTAEITIIRGEQKVEEIAKMLSGEKLSENSKDTARELIGGHI